MKTSLRQPTLSSHQRGAALIFSLMMLLILTLLTVSALRTSSLEQMMAGNTQEQNRAFAAAESALAEGFADTTSFASMSGSSTKSLTYPTMHAEAEVETTWRQNTAVGRSSLPTGQQTAEIAHFDQSVTATTKAGARTVLSQGVKKSIPKTN